ncbi:hypothetical protein [Novipirellula caenicola]|uniref:Uncharacterized protein n=1 Tax=Novipirellula caenicola TaxID=1536901 RepID=A0ABP9VH96_9BACT
MQRSGVAIENAEQYLDSPINVVLVGSGRWLNFVANMSPPSLTVSEDFYQSNASALDKAFAPFPIRIPRTLGSSKLYRFLVPLHRYQIVDFDSAELDYFDDIREPKYARRVLRWVVNPCQVPDLQVFSDRMGLTVVTEDFASRLKHASGIKLIRLKQLHEPLLGT